MSSGDKTSSGDAMTTDKVNILLVDDQPAKLLAYEVILRDLGENLMKAASAREALETLLKHDVAVMLIDVCMPELDGFELAAMVREHPRFQQTAIIFISAIHLTDVDRLRGYEMGGVDYVPVPVVPEVLRAKVKVFAELHRKTRALEKFNSELERRVEERTRELEASTTRLMQSERLRSLALAAGQMGSWVWDVQTGECLWDEGQYRICGHDPTTFAVTPASLRGLVDQEDYPRLEEGFVGLIGDQQGFQAEFRVRRPNGELRWCIGAAAASVDEANRVVRLSGVTVDITERKQAEERRTLLIREVDHRARNALAVVQSIIRLTRAKSIESYIAAVDGRIGALSRAHVLLSESRWEGAALDTLVEEELAPYRVGEAERISVNGPSVLLEPATAQILALALHELATNAAKYGALSSSLGGVGLSWRLNAGGLMLDWSETGGPAVEAPLAQGYGTKVISASIERQLGGRVVFDWRRDGLRCLMTVPLGDQERSARESRNGAPKPAAPAAVEPMPVLAGNRLLLVEDEALIGIMMKDMLTELGFDVLGPYAKISDALAAARDEDFDGAILDVNLNGDLVYPVADLVRSRRVPFVFVTGYGADGVEERFSQVPVLQKPIEPQMLRTAFVRNGDAPHGSAGSQDSVSQRVCFAGGPSVARRIAAVR